MIINNDIDISNWLTMTTIDSILNILTVTFTHTVCILNIRLVMTLLTWKASPWFNPRKLPLF